MTIKEPGVYSIPEIEYHADPVIEPSLSNSIAKILVDRTPRHAWVAHPRLNPHHEEVQRKDFDLGSAAHALLLEGRRNLVVIDADSYRTKDAKEQRDAAYEAGKTPLLKAQMTDVEAMVAAAHAQIDHHQEGRLIFKDGEPEQTLVWRDPDYGCWCRARLDWWNSTAAYIGDYKSTTNAQPDEWQRRLYDLGFDMQVAWYCRGVRVLGLHKAPKFRFVVQETTAPYALSVVGLTPAGELLGEAKVHRALELWHWCTTRKHWPGYPARTCFVDPPPWKEAQWEYDKERREQIREEGREFAEVLIDWQSPLDVKPKESTS